MDFEHSPRTAELVERVQAFMVEHVLPNEGRFEAEVAGAATGEFTWPPLLDELKARARAQDPARDRAPRDRHRDSLSRQQRVQGGPGPAARERAHGRWTCSAGRRCCARSA